MGVYRIGRGDSNDIVLLEASVSREHAELTELGGGRFQIRDLGSTYGVSIWNGQDWEKLTEAELRHDAQIKIGEYQTTVADLLRDLDRTVVHGKSDEVSVTAPPPVPPAPEPAAAPAAPVTTSDPEMTEVPGRAAAPQTAPPAPPKPAPPKPAAPRPAPSRPASPSRTADPATGATMPPQPPAPAFQFLRDLPPEKRILFWLGAGFAGFLLISLITLILALAL